MASVAFIVFGSTTVLAAPPTIAKQSFSGVTTTSATLEGEVNPEGKATEYHFEYGTSDCSSTKCLALPKGKAITGTSPVKVDPVTLTGLAPHTTYHFRIVVNHPKEAAIDGPDATFTTYSLPRVFESCSNDALRADHPSGALPDCRAYEQASPTGKNGLDARGRVALVKASADGRAITYGSAGGLASAEGAQDLPTYLASRDSGDWSTQGLFPPQGKGQSVFVLGWTPSLSQAFTTASRLGPPEDVALLMRSSAGGSLKEVVPYGKGLLNPALNAAGFGFAGTSGEGEEVVFESKSKLTPAAQEGKPNVYAWDKASETLRLVGTLNEASPQGEGKAPSAGTFAGSYDWGAGTNAETLAKGGASAAYYTQDPHAVSSSGDVIFTTAGTGQLYMRQNPTEPQSVFTTNGSGEDECGEAGKACTVHMSASEKSNGKLPNGHDAAGTRPAAFLGASKDGSSVLFSSTEKLTDDATTGTEPPPAAIGRSDLAGTNVNAGFCLGPIAKGVALDGSHIYWVDPSAGTVNRSGLECEDEEVLITGADNPQYVAVDGEHLYWTNAAGGKDGEGTIGSAKLTSGGAEEVDQGFIEGASNPQGVAVQGEFIYWSNAGGEEATQAVGRAKLGAGGAEEVHQMFLVVGEGPQEYRPQGLAVNATHIYMTIIGGFLEERRFLFRFDLDGNPASRGTLFDETNKETLGVRGIALDASHIYWARQGENSIGRIALGDFGTAGSCEAIPSCEPEFIKEAGAPFGLAADASHLYWSVNGEVQPNPGNDLYRWQSSPVAGKHLSDLAVDGGDPNGAEVKGILGASDDAKAVYFVANGVPDGVVGSPNANGESATLGDCKGGAVGFGISFSGQCSLYLSREGQPAAFIARLDGADAADWVPRGAFGGQEGKTARVAADGSAAIFLSERQLTAFDNEEVPELYRYDAAAKEVGCLSCTPTGAPPSQAPTLGNITLATLIPPEYTYTLTRNLSADGKRAFFQSTEALVAEDTNGANGCEEEGTEQKKVPSCQDAYEWEAAGSGSCKEDIQAGGCLYLLSSGKSPRASFFAEASESGDDAFIATAEAGLVGQDQDQLYDIFDARKEGGLASQSPPRIPDCEGAEGCHGPTGAPPSFQSPSSATFNGPGNPKPKCPKGKRLKKGRCVAKKKHHHKAKKHKRSSTHKGGSGR